MDDDEYLKGLKMMRKVWRKIIELGIYSKDKLPVYYQKFLKPWCWNCYFCTIYDIKDQFLPDCEKCPIYKEYDISCFVSGSPYSKWCDSKNPNINDAVDIIMVIESEIMRVEIDRLSTKKDK